MSKILFFLIIFLYFLFIHHQNATAIEAAFDSNTYILKIGNIVSLNFNNNVDEIINVLNEHNINFTIGNSSFYSYSLLISKYKAEIQVDRNTKKIFAFILYFRDTKNNDQIVFNKIITSDFIINYNTNLSDLENMLNSNKIEYTIRKGSWYFVDIKLSYMGNIEYTSDNKEMPESIAIVLWKNQ